VKPIIEIHNISKKYTIGREREPYKSLRESVATIFKPSLKKEDFWALSDISLDIEQGDTVGIIGRNGAGKSTLLKILSKITPPTKGRIVTRGRVASLLEVGTGFHPELSGRENVMMNGSILGMKRADILANFNNIVEFAGVEKFIDTPLKNYSSGMQLRLAFAVAAFLENEILIIDEVLAVGDAEFQKKCIGKMESVSRSGRTIIFVSHQFSAVKNLCKKAMYLRDGKLVEFGKVDQVISTYTSSLSNSQTKKESGKDNSNVSISSAGKNQLAVFAPGEQVRFNFECKRPISREDLKLGIAIKDKHERIVLIDFFTFKKTGTDLRCEICLPPDFLTPGQYSMDLSLQDSYEQFWLEKDIFYFEIDILTTSYEGLTYDYGVVRSALSYREF
jgi:lipopolysaccharide transport system ATP-binding protein